MRSSGSTLRFLARGLVVLGGGLLFALPAAGSGPDAEALIRDGAKAERRYAVEEAASFYAKAAAAALEARACDALLEAAAGLKRCVLMGGSRDPLDAAAAALIARMGSDAACCGPPLGQLALGVSGAGQDTVPALGWLDAAAESARAETDRLYLLRVHGLVAGGPFRDYVPYRAPSAPMNPLSEYFDASVPLDARRVDQVVAGAGTWSGPGDGSMQVRIAQFSQNLYVSFRVTDDEVRDGSGGAGDAVVLSLQATSGSAAAHRRSPAGDEPAAVIRVPAVASVEPRGVDGACTRCWTIVRLRPDGYDILVCLPREGLPGLHLEPGDSYALDAALEDVDADGSTLLRMWGLDADLTDTFLGARVTSVHRLNPPNN